MTKRTGRGISSRRLLQLAFLGLALCSLATLAGEASATMNEMWVPPAANSTWTIDGDWVTVNQQVTRFDWAYPPNAPTTGSVATTDDPKIHLMFIPQVTGSVSCTFEVVPGAFPVVPSGAGR